MTQNIKALSVSEVNRMARSILEEITVWVLGEVDDYEDGYKSAVYFKLKDGQSVLPCMFWKSESISYFPKNGEKVLIFGTLTLYEKNGKFQMVVSKIEAYGEGELLKKREELRKKLQAEGYFDESIKREIPELPVKIGLITSKRGAAIEDFLTNVVKGFEGLEVYFVDSLVQGDAAVKSIVDAFKRLSREKLDVVVLTRGGGDIEDLMCFNTEEVVKAIRSCPFPVISAVGHEVDYTLSDLASDLRVSTPTKAAELISGSYVTLRSDLESSAGFLGMRFQRYLQNFLYEMDIVETSLKRAWVTFKNLPEEIAELKAGLNRSFNAFVENKKMVLASLSDRISALSPTNVLSRGYSISYLSDGTIVKRLAQVKLNDKLSVRLSDGTIGTIVQDKEK